MAGPNLFGPDLTRLYNSRASQEEREREFARQEASKRGEAPLGPAPVKREGLFGKTNLLFPKRTEEGWEAPLGVKAIKGVLNAGKGLGHSLGNWATSDRSLKEKGSDVLAANKAGGKFLTDTLVKDFAMYPGDLLKGKRDLTPEGAFNFAANMVGGGGLASSAMKPGASLGANVIKKGARKVAGEAVEKPVYTVAMKLDDGTVVYGKPGENHGDLFRRMGEPENIDDMQNMGFGNEAAGDYYSRTAYPRKLAQDEKDVYDAVPGNKNRAEANKILVGRFLANKDALPRLERELIENNGFSMHLRDLSEPTSGYMVSLPGKEVIVPGRATQAQIRKYAEDHAQSLGQDGNALGGWYDEATDQTFLDVSKRFDNKQAAIDYGLDQPKPQLTGYDVKGMDVFNVARGRERLTPAVKHPTDPDRVMIAERDKRTGKAEGHLSIENRKPDFYGGQAGFTDSNFNFYDRLGAGRFAEKNPDVFLSKGFEDTFRDTDFLDSSMLWANSKKAAPMSLAPHADFDLYKDHLRPMERRRAMKGEDPEPYIVRSEMNKEAPKTEYRPEYVPFGTNPSRTVDDTVISSRVPAQLTSPNKQGVRNPRPWVEDAEAEILDVNLPTYRTQKAYDQNMSLIPNYPGMGRFKGKSSSEIEAGSVNQMVGNLLHTMQRLPSEMAKRSPKWYEGANRIADTYAKGWGIDRYKVSAALAALSPQKDWFENVSLAQRMGDIMFKPDSLKVKRASPKMVDWAKNANKTGTDDLLYGSAAEQQAIKSMKGKRFDQLTDDTQRAIYIRSYDEVYNPKNIREITPEGDVGPWAMGNEGPKSVSWGSNNEIIKAMRAMREANNPTDVSRILSDTHKVRSFYNNIENPGDPRFATIDTHAVSANLMSPMGQKDTPVLHNFGLTPQRDARPLGFEPASQAGGLDTGLKGTYPLHDSVVKQTSDILGLLPREVQSPTWEAIRAFKNAPGTKREELAQKVWKAFDDGEISLSQARELIMPEGSIPDVSYAARGYDRMDPALRRTYSNPKTLAPMSLMPRSREEN